MQFEAVKQTIFLRSGKSFMAVAERFSATVFIYLKHLDTISAYRYTKRGDGNES